MHKRIATCLTCSLAVGAQVLCEGSAASAETDAERRFAAAAKANKVLKAALAPIRAEEAQMNQRWEDDEDGFRNLPPRAWPPRQPDAEELPELQKRVAAACTAATAATGTAAGADVDAKAKAECETATFDLASCLVFNSLDAELALEHYRSLSAQGSTDATVACGMLLTEGLGVECDEEQGVACLRAAAGVGHAQGCYELASAIYTGAAPATDGGDADAAAFTLFDTAARQQHTGAMFMAGDMLLGGEGVRQDVTRGVQLVYAAAEQGHRFGRQRVRSLLDGTREE